jgi:hypothetical protein
VADDTLEVNYLTASLASEIFFATNIDPCPSLSFKAFLMVSFF